MNIKVLKFGGTSVATREARAAAAQRVADAREQGFRPIAVVSAIGRRGAPYATDTLISEIQEVNPQLPPAQRDLDLIMVCGEMISAAIFTQVCRSLGLNAAALTGNQAGIRTDGKFGNARITAVDPKRILKLLENDIVPVICGFQGAAAEDEEEITTLGRGGTDTTAAAIGAAVRACAVEIYTDVDGIKTADPRFVPTAPTMRKVSYAEVAEMAHLGAKVLHPRSAEIAMRYAIPLWVKNSFSGEEGTEIVPEDVSYRRACTGITHSGKLTYLQFDLTHLDNEKRAKVELGLFGTMAGGGISVHMVNLSPHGMGFAVTREQYALAEKLIDGLTIPVKNGACVLQAGSGSAKADAQVRMLSSLGHCDIICAQTTEECTMLSVISRGSFGKPGVFYQILSILNEEKVLVLQTSDSDFSVSFLIPEIETQRAVRVLHARLVDLDAVPQ